VDDAGGLTIPARRTNEKGAKSAETIYSVFPQNLALLPKS